MAAPSTTYEILTAFTARAAVVGVAHGVTHAARLLPVTLPAGTRVVFGAPASLTTS